MLDPSGYLNFALMAPGPDAFGAILYSLYEHRDVVLDLDLVGAGDLRPVVAREPVATSPCTSLGR